MNYIIRDKARGYGVIDERYATRAEAEANLWRYAHLGGELVIELTFGTSLTKEARARNAPAEYTPSSELGDGTEVELMERPQIRRKKIRRAKVKQIKPRYMRHTGEEQ